MVFRQRQNLFGEVRWQLGLDEMENLILPISVVIPTHNSEQTISRAMKSVLDQDQLPAEIIVVDDCSSDQTVQKVNDVRIPPGVHLQVIQLDTNQGPSAARNHGWNSATTEYVAFLDSDDSWHRAKLAIQYRVMKSMPAFGISGHLTGTPTEIDSSVDAPVRQFGLRQFLIRNRISTPTVMVQRSISDRFDIDFWYAEDYEFWLRYLAKHQLILRIELPLAHLHKADYGESGLSARMYQMFRGELEAITKLRSTDNLSIFLVSTTIGWMSLKFLLRLTRTKIRKLR